MPFDNPTILIEKLNNCKKDELKSWCKYIFAKQSIKGVVNKYTMRLNIFKTELKRKPTDEEEFNINFG